VEDFGAEILANETLVEWVLATHVVPGHAYTKQDAEEGRRLQVLAPDALLTVHVHGEDIEIESAGSVAHGE
jgi:hypothetical protein